MLRAANKTIMCIVVLAVLLTALNGVALTSSAQGPDVTDKIAPEVGAAMASAQADEMLSVIVTLRAQADLSQIPAADRAARQEGVIRALQAKAAASQRQIQAFLTVQQAQGTVAQFTSFWVFNGLSVTGTAEVIQELAARPDVLSITSDAISIVPASPPAWASPEANVSLINAPALWGLGWTGQGAVVANMDSGVDVGHPDLAARWRGGSNSWFDPYGQHPATPTDLSGHGTWTMGVMVGGDAGGTSIGVAPGARWVAVKIFNDQGGSTATAIHQGLQWLLDPDGNPATPDAPHAVNNSWTYANPGCYLEFELDLQSLRAAGVLPVFAAGNGGPNAGTSYSPANNPSAFAVGATNNSDTLYTYSSRGPSACGEAQTVFPEVVAPGVGIRTSDLFGLYTQATGTSLAAPHVAGGLALLLSAYPNLTAAEQEAALLNSVVDLGPAGPDNNFGYGRLDILATYHWLSSPPSYLMHVQRIDMAVVAEGGTWNHAEAMVTVLNAGGAPVSGATVSGSFSGDSSGADSRITDANGQATLRSPRARRGANWAFCIDSITQSDYTYDPGANGETCDSTTGPGPTSTPTPTPTATPGDNPTPTPTPTATPGSGITMHVGDLDGSSSSGSRGRWNATVSVTAHSANEAPLAGATVNGTWSNGASGSGSCTTGSTGRCSLTKSNIKDNVSGVAFTVISVAHPTHTYLSTDNHDPDGDSDGTAITVARP